MSDPIDALRDANPVSEQEGQEWARGSAGLAARDAATSSEGLILLGTEPAPRPARSRMLVAAAVLLVVLGSGGFLALRATDNTTAVDTGSEPSTTSEPVNEQPPVVPESRAFNPQVEALGLTMPEDLAELQAAEKAFSARLSEGDAEALMVNAAWEKAIEDLYDRVSKRPESAAARQEWVQCFAGAGYDVKNPTELNDLSDTLSGSEFDALVEVSKRCEDEGSASLSIAVEAEFPAWAADNEQVIADYRAALGLK